MKKSRRQKQRAGQRGAKRSTAEETPASQIRRTTHVHRSRAHTSSAGRRQQKRRDSK